MAAFNRIAWPQSSESAATNVIGGTWSWISSGALTLATLAVPSRYTHWWLLLRAAVLPTLAGWLVGCNVLVLNWGTSAYSAFVSKGGAAPNLPLGEVWQRADVSRFILAWHWHWFIAVLVGSIVVLLLVLIVHRRSREGALPFVAIFAVTVLALTMVSAADVSFLRPPGNVDQFGQESRYFFLIIAPVALLGVVGFLGTPLTSGAAGLIYTLLVTLSFSDYYSVARAVWPGSRLVEERIERELQTHLADSQDNVVVCLRVVQPRQCAMLYGFNNYQNARSLAKYESRALENGKVKYAADLAAACEKPGFCMEPGRELFVSDKPPQISSVKVIGNVSPMYVFQLTVPWSEGRQPALRQQ